MDWIHNYQMFYLNNTVNVLTKMSSGVLWLSKFMCRTKLENHTFELYVEGKHYE